MNEVAPRESGGEFLLYQTEDGQVKLEVRLQHVNAISNRLSQRALQRDSLEIKYSADIIRHLIDVREN